MPWYYLEITDANGGICRSEIEAFNESEARITVQNQGYSINRIRKKRIKSIVYSAFYWIDQRVRPAKYDYDRQLDELATRYDNGDSLHDEAARDSDA